MELIVIKKRYNDHLEHSLGTELENARLVRLMSKLGFINERPEYYILPLQTLKHVNILDDLDLDSISNGQKQAIDTY